METPPGTWLGTYRTEQYISEEFDSEMEILGSRSSLVFEQETLCPEEYLSENSRPHIHCKGHTLAASAVVPWVLALSSDLPRAESDVFKADVGSDGAGSQKRLVAAVSLLSSCLSTKKQNTNPSSPTQMSCCPRAFVSWNLVTRRTQMLWPWERLL